MVDDSTATVSRVYATWHSIIEHIFGESLKQQARKLIAAAKLEVDDAGKTIVKIETPPDLGGPLIVSMPVTTLDLPNEELQRMLADTVWWVLVKAYVDVMRGQANG